MKTIKIGIIGAGRIGRVHAENIAKFVPEMEIKTIADPYMSEETVAFLQRLRIPNIVKDADVILKATTVDGVYDSDPKKNPQAKRYDTLTFMEVLSQNLAVMDMTAASFCKDRGIPWLVFSMEDPENIVRAIAGEPVGTLVK